MGLVPTFSPEALKKKMAQQVQQIEEAIINRLKHLGKQCVAHARSSTSFTNRTGNLRNSIGFVLLKNGSIIAEDFERSASMIATIQPGRNKGTTHTTKDSKDGLIAGQSLAKSLAGKYAKGFALIVVAGMNYAAYVEAKGRDVLTTAEQLAEKELPGMLAKLKHE